MELTRSYLTPSRGDSRPHCHSIRSTSRSRYAARAEAPSYMTPVAPRQPSTLRYVAHEQAFFRALSRNLKRWGGGGGGGGWQRRPLHLHHRTEEEAWHPPGGQPHLHHRPPGGPIVAAADALGDGQGVHVGGCEDLRRDVNAEAGG